MIFFDLPEIETETLREEFIRMARVSKILDFQQKIIKAFRQSTEVHLFHLPIRTKQRAFC